MSESKKSSEELVKNFFQAMQTMDNLYEEYAESHGMTFMSFYILETLCEHKKCTQKEISDITHYPKQTVNMIIRGFLEKRWVTLETDSFDKRRKLVILTESGENHAKQIVDPFYSVAEESFSELAPSECAVMVEAFLALAQNLDEKVSRLSKSK